MMADNDWKKRLGFHINYTSSQSSEDEDTVDTCGSAVEKRWQNLDAIAAEYDHLSSTPPRTRIRNKERYRSYNLHEVTHQHAMDIPKQQVPRRNTTDNFPKYENIHTQEGCVDNKKYKRRSLKLLRGSERDLKLDIAKCKNCRPDYMPLSTKNVSIPTLVESCNRFMSLSSRPVPTCREQTAVAPLYRKNTSDLCLSSIVPLQQSGKEGSNSSREDSIDNRAVFHSTFSMLIRMGNAEKNASCKRTMSVEEHTWQNELKDLVWLEVCAKKAGRTPTQQDAFLCTRRDEVPALLQEILDFKFQSSNTCAGGNNWYQYNFVETVPEERASTACLNVNCMTCCANIGEAMRKVVRLLDALADAEALYPSTKAMALHHPVIMQREFIDKTKAMCLWYNMVRCMRQSLIIIKKLLVNHRWRVKTDTTTNNPTLSVGSSSGVYSVKSQRVTFSIEPGNATESSSSGDADSQCTTIDNSNVGSLNHHPSKLQAASEQSDDETDSKSNVNVHIEITSIQSNDPLTIDGRDSVEGFLKVRSISQEGTKSPYESADSSSGSVNSTESGFVSAYDTQEDMIYGPEKNLFDIGDLTDLTKLRLFYPNRSSPYRDYLEKVLKSRGIRRALYFLEKMHLHLLKKTRMTLEKLEDVIKSHDLPADEDCNDTNPLVDTDGEQQDSDDDFEFEQHERCHVDVGELKKEHLDRRRYGAWSKETLEMQLPSYRSIFLYLSTLPMENIHEFLSMKLETKPEKPSVLSIKQLIGELRDGLMIAVRVRARFIRHIQIALQQEPEKSDCRIVFNNVLDTFEKTLDSVYKLYLSYLSDWAGVEHLPRATLAAEWAFNCYLARSLKPAATLSPLTFCCLTVRQLDGAADRLKTRVAELGKEAYKIRVMKQEDDDSQDSVKWLILTKCRAMQCLLTEERERILSTSQFARTVSMHLHHNSIFRNFRQKIYKAMSDVRDVICWLITNTEDTTSPKRLAELEDPDKPSVQSRTREIVSQAYKFGFEFHKEMCRLINDTLSPECLYNPCARNSLSQNRRSKLIRSESIIETNHTSLEETMFYLTTPTVTNQEFQYPCNGNPRMTMKKFKEDSLSKCLYKSGYKSFQRNFIQGTKFPSFDSIASGISLADLNSEDFKSGIPGCDECNRVKGSEDEKKDGVNDSNTDWEENVSRSLVTFSKQWMSFAMQRCERGRGLRPRWASHGLEFLMLTCDPQHTKHLSDAEFEELKEMMDSCISHVIGTAGSTGPSAAGTPTLNMPTPQRTRSSINYPQNPMKPMASSPPPTQDFQAPAFTEAARIDKRVVALCELDHKRDSSLRKGGVIGFVRHGTESRDHFRPRPVTFKWQRGIKIGQGRFGKVYTVVNTESGCLLAMKEVSLALGDRRAVERAANELKILEGVVHPNLVQYYGVEIHREEMLIFMELCVEGSLEALIADICVEGGATGLPETLVRKYTRQLVSAARALHVRAIAHRDIKSGNIFLTEGGNCLKLGDFGCAVKIRANTTVPGELQGYVGTQAYMAPEVFMKSSGHGRAADIWSLGCVVVEMSSGKRPWSEYDSNYQIMFVVGMGGRPEPPSTLSPEGEDFCYSCLQHDPAQRATIDTLSHHHFIKTNNLHEDLGLFY